MAPLYVRDHNGRRFSGVKISSQQLVIASVEHIPSGPLRLCPEASCEFALAGRDQADLLGLFDEVRGFVRRLSIHTLVIRGSPPSGPHQGSGLGFKIEALLQFLPQVRIEIVQAVTLTAWLKRNDPLLPPADRARLGYKLAKLQDDAIAMASWASVRSKHTQWGCEGYTSQATTSLPASATMKGHSPSANKSSTFSTKSSTVYKMMGE